MSRATRDAKRQVLGVHPHANCKRRSASWKHRYVIYTVGALGEKRTLGHGATKGQAWADALTTALADALTK